MPMYDLIPALEIQAEDKLSLSIGNYCNIPCKIISINLSRNKGEMIIHIESLIEFKVASENIHFTKGQQLAIVYKGIASGVYVTKIDNINITDNIKDSPTENRLTLIEP